MSFHQAIATTSILVEIAQELVKKHPIKHEPSLTSPKIHINQTLPFRKQLRRRYHPPTTPNNVSQKSLKNLRRHIQSSTSLHSHLPKYTLI
jgi:hypothetical protein